MSKIEAAISQMEEWANDPSHGYDQQFRWGQFGDFDCSAAVITAWELAGVPAKTRGATYTGNMYEVFMRLGFADVTASVNLATGDGLMRGDVLLNHSNHTAMYCGGGREVEALMNEKKTVTGGQPGDQTGAEFLVRGYRNYPWDAVLRYTEEPSGVGEGVAVAPGYAKPSYEYTVKLGLLQEGMADPQITSVQQLLTAKGYKPGATDGIMGPATVAAVKAFQARVGLDNDGEVGGQTWAALLKT